jgi:hypothetical protein
LIVEELFNFRGSCGKRHGEVDTSMVMAWALNGKRCKAKGKKKKVGRGGGIGRLTD